MTDAPRNKNVLRWEELTNEGGPGHAGSKVLRSRIPGGWLVWAHTANADGMTFVPDPDHAWDGGSTA
jgi:hypothetical protein